MKKYIISANLLLIVFLILSGCSLKHKTPTPEQILADYNEEYSSESYANFNKIVVNSEHDNGSVYVANVVLKGEDEYAEYTLETDVYYSFKEEKGWLLAKRTSNNIDKVLVRGRSEEEIEKWISENKNTCIPTSREHTYFDIINVSSSFEKRGIENVNVKWIEERYGIRGECEAKMEFYYDGHEWKHQGTKIINEKYAILNMENSVWRYKYKKTQNTSPSQDILYYEFVIKNISDDGLCLTAEYDGKTYIGYANEGETVDDGAVEYYFPEDGVLQRARLVYPYTQYCSATGGLKLYIDIPYGGYYDFVRMN